MKKKMISVALIGCLVSSLLTGCMQSEDAVKFNEDGSVKISAVIRVEKDAVDSSEGTTTINGKDPKTFKVTTINGIDSNSVGKGIFAHTLTNNIDMDFVVPDYIRDAILWACGGLSL